jgi:hypothetical protein
MTLKQVLIESIEHVEDQSDTKIKLHLIQNVYVYITGIAAFFSTASSFYN